MGAKRTIQAIDPATGKPLPEGVQYRGPKQYWARKLVSGKRVAKTFDTAKEASSWRKAVEVDQRRGVFVDMSAAERHSLGSVLRAYQLEVLGDDPDREIIGDDGRPCPYASFRPAPDVQTTDLLGAGREIGFIDVILRDEVCAIKMARLMGADLAKFRNRMKADGYAASTIVRRLNLIARAISVARAEWGINIPTNPADAEQCARPKGADNKRDRVLMPASKSPPVAATSKADRSSIDPQGVVLPPFSERDDFKLGEEERLLRACAKVPEAAPDTWLLSAVKLAIATAMRQGEICALEWADIDFDHRTITVRGPERADGRRCTKNRTIRIVPMLDDAYRILTSLPRGSDKRVIKVDQNALKMRYRRAVKNAGLEDLTFHDLRHVGTSRLAKIYKDPLTLRLVTGHKDLKSLARYFHKSPAELLDEANRVLLGRDDLAASAAQGDRGNRPYAAAP